MPSSSAARARQVERRRAAVGAAVDHGNHERLAVVGQRHRRPAGQRAVGDADDRAAHDLAAGRVAAVEPGPVPGRDDLPVDRQRRLRRRDQCVGRGARGDGRARRSRLAASAGRRGARASRGHRFRRRPRRRARRSASPSSSAPGARRRRRRSSTAATPLADVTSPTAIVDGATAERAGAGERPGRPRGAGACRSGAVAPPVGALPANATAGSTRSADADAREAPSGCLNVCAQLAYTVTVAYGVSCRARASCARAVRPAHSPPRRRAPHLGPPPVARGRATVRRGGGEYRGRPFAARSAKDFAFPIGNLKRSGAFYVLAIRDDDRLEAARTLTSLSKARKIPSTFEEYGGAGRRTTTDLERLSRISQAGRQPAVPNALRDGNGTRCQ